MVYFPGQKSRVGVVFVYACVCGLLVLCVCKCVCVCEVSGHARACCGVHLRLVIKIWLCVCFGGYYKWIVASV